MVSLLGTGITREAAKSQIDAMGFDNLIEWNDYLEGHFDGWGFADGINAQPHDSLGAGGGGVLGG